jgi:hypothetical protein
VVEGWGAAEDIGKWKGELYRSPPAADKMKRAKIRAVPYFLWDNRKPGAMAVWLPRA